MTGPRHPSASGLCRIDRPNRLGLLATGLVGAAALILLASCTAERQRTGDAPPATEAQPASAPTSEPAAPANANEAGATIVAANLESLPTARLDAALAAFRISCLSLIKRSDASGLTRAGDWDAACAAAEGATDSRGFFAEQFSAVRIGDGSAFATGYFEPQIAGQRTKAPGYEVPVYAVPSDLIDVDLGEFSDVLKGKRIRGRVEKGTLVPYFDRAAIEAGALDGRAKLIGYAADPVELFFLHVQGSGRLIAPDGSVIRIGYAGQNGRDYVGIGKLLADRGVLAKDKRSMQGIMEYLRADPARGAAVMRENPSYIFFQELTGPGPLGALGRPVTPRVTVAADPKFVPLGAPVLLELDRDEADGLWIAQDTGGAIKGANRFDTFWGGGAEARDIAGGMSGRGSALLLLPKDAADRLAAAPAR